MAFYFDLARTSIPLDGGGTAKPILPLSRHLSSLAVRSMHKRLGNLFNDDLIEALEVLFEEVNKCH